MDQFANFRRLASPLGAVVVLLILLAGCAIEESERGLTGSVTVSLSDPEGVFISGALIYVDDVAQAQRTPATLTDVAIGARVIRVSRPGYNDVSSTIDVQLNQTVVAALQTTLAPVGAIQLAGAPEGTTLLINNLPYGVAPPEFFSVGIGSYTISAYLEGHATELPSFWSREITIGDTMVLSPRFTPVAAGAHPDSLVPSFALFDDRDSTQMHLAHYRGRVCVVTFFYYYCAPCLAEFPYIQATYAEPDYAGKVEFFGVDSQDPWTLFERYRRDHPTLRLTFPLVFDPGMFTTRDFQVTVHPANFVIDKTGRIRYRFGQITESVLRDAIDGLLAEGN
ncbi:redoxin domain-containing protein [candidate division KSB1 bacterium]|nr:redoxin domain-containing protein [candidate division KSB1 bacterium]